eukprot:TRINITY_DN105714_c0_g1_i1.p1 TRINITY_DN105714_c0_g1~~TRINITY_DN105714_c0_g1_i1.p1  ORF type:complete len:401 (-),score=51.80 TRINITY_DN105714_c0_g1_i1:219-1421(-)
MNRITAATVLLSTFVTCDSQLTGRNYSTRCGKAPPRIPQDEPFCNREVGTCWLFGCWASHGATADCIEGKCYCKSGMCDSEGTGKCRTAPPAPPPVPAPPCEQGKCGEGQCLFPAWSVEEAVKEMNRRFQDDGEGLFMRGIEIQGIKPFLQKKCARPEDWKEPEKCPDNPLMSFVLMNHFSWDSERSRLTMYPKDGGIISSQNTPMRCLFPSDAGTVSRQSQGCGAWHLSLAPDSGKSDWCNPFPADTFIKDWHGYLLQDLWPQINTTYTDPVEWTGCALKGNQRKEMLELFGKMKKAGAVTQGPYVKRFGHPGKVLPSNGNWNEALASGIYWNQIVDTHVEAFYILDYCDADLACKQQATRVISEYKEMYGFAPPLIAFSTFKRENPFYVPGRGSVVVV